MAEICGGNESCEAQDDEASPMKATFWIDSIAAIGSRLSEHGKEREGEMKDSETPGPEE